MSTAPVQPVRAAAAPPPAPAGNHILLVSSERIQNFGGVGMVIQRLIRGLPERFRVSLACPETNPAELADDLRARLAGFHPIPGHKWTRADRAAFLGWMRGLDCDLVNFHGGLLTFDAHLPWRSPLHALGPTGVPWIHTNHCVTDFSAGLFPERYPFPLKLVKRALAYASIAWLLTRTARQVMVSDENAGRLKRWFPGVGRKLTTIYSARIEGAAPAPGFRDPVLTLANLGHIGWRKGQHDLFSAFALLAKDYPQLNLLLVGPVFEPECDQWIRGEAQRLGLQDRVRMPGGLNDLRAFWDEADIYVQPSHYEGAPMSLMEALWHGKPAVGTRVSGIPEIIEDGVTGLLVEPRQPAALAAALKRLLDEPETRRRFGGAGPSRILAKGMTGAQMVECYARTYDEVLARHRKS